MGSVRVRSRWKRDSRYLSTLKNSVGTTLRAVSTHTSTSNESMIDTVIKDWARLKRDGTYVSPSFEHSAHLGDASRIGFDERYFSLIRFIPPVNTLTYSAVNNDEVLDDITFWNTNLDPPASKLVIGKGNILQTLHSAWGNAFPAAPTVSGVLTPVQMVAVLKSRVLQRCADTSYSFGEDCAEIRETLRFIRSPLRSMYRLVNTLHRKITGTGKRSTKRIANDFISAYAEQRFAMGPLLRSVDSALQASADYFYKKSKERYIRIFDAMESSGQALAFGSTTKNFPYSGMTGLSWDVKSSYLRTLLNVAEVGIKVFHADQSSFGTLVGLRGRDIPLVIWQTLPLSFVFDRFYDVSAWLQASSNFLSTNVRFAGGWVSTRVTERHTRRYEYLNATGTTTKYVVPSSTKPWVLENFSFSREPWEPQLSEARPPALAGRLVKDLTSTADLVAVTTGRLSRAARFVSSAKK